MLLRNFIPLILLSSVYSVSISPLTEKVTQKSRKHSSEPLQFSVIRDKKYEGRDINWHFGYIYFDEHCNKIIEIDSYDYEDIKELSGDVTSQFEPGESVARVMLDFNFKAISKKGHRMYPTLGVSSVKPQAAGGGVLLETRILSQVRPTLYNEKFEPRRIKFSVAHDENFDVSNNSKEKDNVYADEVQDSGPYLVTTMFCEKITNKNPMNIKFKSTATFFDRYGKKLIENVPAHRKSESPKNEVSSYVVGGNYHGYIFYPVEKSLLKQAAKIRITHVLPKYGKKIIKTLKVKVKETVS
ncbi:hypothetical protein N9N03_00500 [Chlamydiia bacterium]|nr:hypothetical protein [Chlamydiia bacterium]